MNKTKACTRKRKQKNTLDETKRESSSEEEDLKNSSSAVTKLKTKRVPLPMKLRALPQSFWQQPNASGTVSPTTYCPPLDEDMTESSCHSQVVGVANTELLFSLFRTVNNNNDEVSTKQIPIVRRGRPRKVKDAKQIVKVTKDDDPYFTSAIVPQIQVEDEEKLAQGRQVLAMISVSGESEDTTLNSTYSQRLSDLVINL